MIRILSKYISPSTLGIGVRHCRPSTKIGYRAMAPFHLTATTSDSNNSQSPESPDILAKRQQIQSLRDTISHKQPLVFGTSAIPADQWALFYGTRGNAGRIDLSNASETELEHLSKACQPATFGVNQEDVLDESYRKAGKIDVTDFATKFVLEDSSLIDVVRSELLEGHETNKAIKAELYKLNVYGKGAFFKPHKDTPRSTAMFGSLVIVFATKHEGGALILRHGGCEWTFDSASMIAAQTDSSIAYAAFYSDVEHEVTPVRSGYRITLTYNLYFSTDSASSPTLPTASPSTVETTFKKALSTLLSDNNFMPTGGFLGFGLRHEYPLDPQAGLGNLINCLKGNDAIIKRVCSQLSLQTLLRVVYRDDDNERGPYFVIVKDIVDYSQMPVTTTIGSLMTEYQGGKRVTISGPIAEGAERNQYLHYDWGDQTDDRPEVEIDVDWVTDLTEFTVAKTPYAAYGNQATLEYMYGNVCLLVYVGPPEDRTKNMKEPLGEPRY